MPSKINEKLYFIKINNNNKNSFIKALVNIIKGG